MIKFKTNPEVTYKMFEGEVNILDYKTANIHSLNETASFIWQKLVQPMTKAELVKVIEEEFSASKEEIKKDLEDFLEKYLKKEFIVKVKK